MSVMLKEIKDPIQTYCENISYLPVQGIFNLALSWTFSWNFINLSFRFELLKSPATTKALSGSQFCSLVMTLQSFHSSMLVQIYIHDVDDIEHVWLVIKVDI